MSLAWAILPFQRRTPMRRFYLVVAVAIAMFAPIGLAQHAGPYKVLKTARVGGEGGWDYIYADVAGRRLYIPRRGTPPNAAPAVQTRLTIFNLDTLEPIGEIAGIGGNGAAVDPKSGHGFTSSKPVSMFDAKTMKAIAHYPFGDKGRCNGLALDVKNQVLFAACANSGNPPVQPAQPMMVILSARDGKIITSLPLAGGSDGAVFNPSTMEAFSTHGNGTLTVVKEKSPTSFEVEQNLDTMNGARTITFDSKTNHIFAMSQERGPAPPPPPSGGRGGQAPVIPGSFTILLIGK